MINKITKGMFELNEEDFAKLQAAIDRSFEQLEAENEEYQGVEVTFFLSPIGRSVKINNSDVYHEANVIMNV